MLHSDSSTEVFSLSANQTKALAALIQTNTVAEAAEQAGLSTATLWRYLADPGFASAYRKQRMLILQQAVASLTNLSARAVEKFEEALNCGDINAELRSASRVLDYLIRSVELERRLRDQDEIEERLTRLEEAEDLATSEVSGASGAWG